MYWYDWVTLVIMAGVTIIQTVRGIEAGGMGLPLFEAAGVVVAAVASTALAHVLAGAIGLDESTVLFVLFVALSVLGLLVGRWLFSLTALSMESFDGLFSFLFGLVMAWAIAHMVLRGAMMLQGSNGEIATNIAHSPVVREVFSFRTWNALIRLLFNAKFGSDFDPTQG